MMPSIANALKAAKFCASPTETIISLRICALGKSNSLKEFKYKELLARTPPLTPTEIGNSNIPWKTL